MKPEHEAILAKCLQRQQDIAERDIPAWRLRYDRQLQDEQQYGPRYAAGEWFGDIPNYQRQRYLRAIADLEAGRLIDVYRYGGRRLSNISLTPEGEQLAKSLLESK